METIEIILSQGARNRIQRIKQLRRQQKDGIILDDNEIILTAIAHYWAAVERRADYESKTRHSPTTQPNIQDSV